MSDGIKPPALNVTKNAGYLVRNPAKSLIFCPSTANPLDIGREMYYNSKMYQYGKVSLFCKILYHKIYTLVNRSNEIFP